MGISAYRDIGWGDKDHNGDFPLQVDGYLRGLLSSPVEGAAGKPQPERWRAAAICLALSGHAYCHFQAVRSHQHTEYTALSTRILSTTRLWRTAGHLYYIFHFHEPPAGCRSR